MSDDSPPDFTKIVFNRIEQAANHVGTISACAAILVFGLASLFFSTSTSVSLSISVFSLCGMLEAFHVQRTTQLEKRSELCRVNDLMQRFTRKYPKWNPKILKEFNHNGFGFKTIGFDQLPIPIGITNPLCPACHEAITSEAAKCEFPGRITITLQCLCGYSCISDKTIAELKMEAASLGSLVGQP